MATTKLVLFDIDHTLVDPGGIGRYSVTRAFSELFSVKDAFSGIKMAGRTDIQIVKEALSVHRISSGNGIILMILNRYLEILERQTDKIRIKPGVAGLLGHLESTEGFYPGLLTGNISQGARIKLAALNLNRHFPFGAFGDDHEDRNELLPIAVDKFRMMTGMDVAFRDCIVIGDTPHDVQCATAWGAISIAVSTGPYSYESLMETEADYVVSDLREAGKLRLLV